MVSEIETENYKPAAANTGTPQAGARTRANAAAALIENRREPTKTTTSEVGTTVGRAPKP